MTETAIVIEPLPPDLRDDSEERVHPWTGATRLVALCEDVIHLGVALVLLVVGIYVLAHTVADFAAQGATFAERITGAINGVLFVVIVMEILRTVAAHFERDGFQLRPFLIIGIISAVRHILTVGAQISLGVERGPDAFRQSQIELGVNSGVALVLVISLFLVRRSGEAHD